MNCCNTRPVDSGLWFKFRDRVALVLDVLPREAFCQHLHIHFWVNQRRMNHCIIIAVKNQHHDSSCVAGDSMVSLQHMQPQELKSCSTAFFALGTQLKKNPVSLFPDLRWLGGLCLVGLQLLTPFHFHGTVDNAVGSQRLQALNLHYHNLEI